MNAQANTTPAQFTPGQKLSTRSICDSDCIYRGTVVKRTAKRVTLDLGREGLKTVGIFIDYNGHEACFPFGRYSMAAIFSSGDSYIAEKPAPEPAPVAAAVHSNIIEFPAKLPLAASLFNPSTSELI